MNLRVVFQIVETGEVVEKEFDSMYFCRRFVNKLRHSKRCRLLSYPPLS